MEEDYWTVYVYIHVHKRVWGCGGVVFLVQCKYMGVECIIYMTLKVVSLPCRHKTGIMSHEMGLMHQIDKPKREKIKPHCAKSSLR